MSAVLIVLGFFILVGFLTKTVLDFRIKTKEKNVKKIVVLLVVLLVNSSCGFEIVDTGYRGIKTRFGQVQGDALPEGLHFYNPVTSNVREYLVRENTWESETVIFTKDTQRVDVSFAVTYYPDPNKVTKLYKEIGDYDDLTIKIFSPVVLGSLKDAIGEVIADELVSKREVVTKNALEEVRDNLLERGIFVTDLQFTNLDFDDSYEQAVEAKVVAIQKAQEAKNKTVQVQEEANQKVLTAKAEAEAMKIKSEALSQNKGLTEFEAVRKWNGVLPQYILGGGVTPFIDLNSLGAKK